MMPSHKSFPIDRVLGEVRQALRSHQAAVLQAEPGAGKTTRVPLALLDEPWLAGKRILMLEPRRLAATNAARYMAACLGETVGATVGYAIRFERRASAQTRLEVVTEGILTRRLQADPTLEGVGLVIFDEFHERNLNSDLALALCRDAQLGLREDLKLLVIYSGKISIVEIEGPRSCHAYVYPDLINFRIRQAPWHRELECIFVPDRSYI